MMLGLIGEVALREHREAEVEHLLPVVREERT
jgi:hypothetical protein